MAVNRLMLEDVFTRRQADVIGRLANLLETYIAQYDVTLLIARKAVCLVRALQKNGYMPRKLPGVVFSSRASSFKNMLDVSGRVALVDEVGITLNTVSRTRATLRHMGCEPDVLLGAICANDDEVFHAAGANVRIVRRMSKVEVLEFAKAISRYIQLSGITSSCDQPVFALDAQGIDHVRLVQKLPVANVATEEQRGRGILCETITFDARDWLQRIGMEASGSLVKVRLYADKARNKLSLVPFVIPGAMSVESVNRLFESLAQDNLAALVPGDSREDVEARLRLALYGLSRDLGQYVLQLVGIHGFEKVQPVSAIERMSLGQEVSHSIKTCPPQAEEMRMLECVNSAQIAVAVGSIRTGVLAKEKRHGTWWLSATQLSKVAGYAVGNGECVGPVVSAALDLLVDEGLMVPCPTLGNEGPLIRQYRSGEVSRLAREHLQALGGALDMLGIPKEGGTQYRDVVNRLGVLYGRYLEADSKMPTVANPLMFSYLGDSVIVGRVRMGNYDLFHAIERVSADTKPPEQEIVDKAKRFMFTLKLFANDYEPNKDHFGAGSPDDALNLLDKLIEGDARILFEEARLALVSGYHCAVLNGTIDDDLKKQFKKQSSALASKPTDKPLDKTWVHEREFDDSYGLYTKEHYLKLVAPRRTAEDEVVRAKNEVISYLRKAPENKESATYEGEMLIAKFEILENELFCGDDPQVVDEEIGCVTIAADLPRYKVCTFVNSNGSTTLRQSPIVSQGEMGVVVFFPQEGVRPRYLSSSPEATLSQISGRTADLNYVFPSEARLATRDLFISWKNGKVGERILYLVCKPNWEGLESAVNELVKELDKDTSKVCVHKRLAEHTIPFGGLGLPCNEAWCVAFALNQKNA